LTSPARPLGSTLQKNSVVQGPLPEKREKERNWRIGLILNSISALTIGWCLGRCRMPECNKLSSGKAWPMPVELIVAEIERAFFEYRANFKEPITIFWTGGRQGEIINAMHKALGPWRVGLENVTWNQVPKNAGEIQLMFGVPSLLAGIQVGVGGVTMTALNPDWSRAPELVTLFDTGLEALKTSTGQNLQSQVTTLGFHVKPGKKPFKEIVAQFVNAQALGGADATAYGVSVYWNDYFFVMDNSAVVSGGVFVKLVRSFPAEKKLADIAATLFKDEETVLGLLGLKLQ